MPDDSARIAKAIAFAREQLGKPYRFGSHGPDSWDCSGLVSGCYKQIGIKLIPQTGAMVRQGKAVKPDLSVMQPGDAIFPHPGHVQLYIGGGKVIEAYDTGYPVKVSKVSRMWRVRRFVGDGVTTPTNTATFTSANKPDNSGGSIDGLGTLVDWITDPASWLRIAEFAAGIVLMLFALLSAIKAGKRLT